MSRHHHTPGGRVPEQLRRVVLAESSVCWLCGRPGATTVDHVVPLEAGGTSTRDNLMPAHGFCNSQRGARPWSPPARIAVPGPPRGGDA